MSSLVSARRRYEALDMRALGYFLPIMVAVVIGIIYYSPNWIMSQRLAQQGQSYSPLEITDNSDETVTYATRVRKVLDGQWIASDVDTFEYKDGPSAMPILPPIILAGMTLLTGSVSQTFAIADLLFPVAIYLLLFAVCLSLTGNRWFSLLATLFMIANRNIGTGVLPPLRRVKSRVGQRADRASTPSRNGCR